MKTSQWRWDQRRGWQRRVDQGAATDAQLVLVFGGKAELEEGSWLADLRRRHPRALVVSASTAGEISCTEVTDDTIVATAVQLERAQVAATSVRLEHGVSTFQAASQLAAALPARADLQAVLVFSDGIQVNGSELARGLRTTLPAGVSVTGGLAGDGARMKTTLVGLDDLPRSGNIVAVGLYGEALAVQHGCLGGWDPFGPERVITRSRENVLYELDGRPALDLYRQYLGAHAHELPASGLLFPLAIRARESPKTLVRTILGIDHNEGALVLAGDMPEGGVARLMRATFDGLVDGAIGAARGCLWRDTPPQLALLVSCVGRKLLLKQRIEEEVEGVRDVLGDSTVLAGFYSYGEISPLIDGVGCELHNQTMTITGLSEVWA